jgi:tetratricopeptide (TPR) repeat protein
VILMSDHGFHPDHLRPASIPDIPAGPAIEHRDFGILAISGPGIKKDELLHGPSVLDIAPTILTLYGLPVGEDMDGKVLAGVRRNAGGRVHSELGRCSGRGWTASAAYAARSGGGARSAGTDDRAGVYRTAGRESRGRGRKTIRELRYNLGEAYQDDDRHKEAHEILRSCMRPIRMSSALPCGCSFPARRWGCTGGDAAIVDDLDGRRRALFEEARRRGLAEGGPELSADGALRWRNLARYQPPVIDYLKAQVLTAEKRYPEALAALERVTEAHLVRPGLFLQTADLYLRLGRWRDAQRVYEKALEIDPDNAHAHLGLCRMALRRRKFGIAAQSALDALQRIYHYPQAHFLLGQRVDGNEGIRAGGRGVPGGYFFQSELSGSACSAGGIAGEAPWKRCGIARASIGELARRHEEPHAPACWEKPGGE